MKIVVCMKQIVHTYARSGMEPEEGYLSSEDRVRRVNPADECAFLLALRARALAGEAEIICLTLGPLTAGEALRDCLALGADRLCRIDALPALDPWGKSAVLAAAIGDLGADLVLCGTESLDTRNGQVGALLAQRLDVPFVSCVRDVALSDVDGWLEVERAAGRGVRERIACLPPAVFSVEAGAGELPLPPYEAKQRSRSLPVQVFHFEFGENPPPARVVRTRTFPPRPRPKAPPPPDSRLSAYDRTRQLLAGSLVEKRGEILTGSLESQVEGIVRFLERHGFLEAAKKGPEE